MEPEAGVAAAAREVIARCRKRHAAADVLAFFKLIDKQVPRSLDIHVVLDNLFAHTAPEVTAWLTHPRRARWHLHFIPTSSSWLNLAERWFRELTDRGLRRGVFTSVPALIEAITAWVAHGNEDPKPFVWHAVADEILTKVRRGRKTLAQVTSMSQ
jgi:transposase